MDKATYARTILADRQASGSFRSALGRSIGRRNALPVLALTFALLGAVWIRTGMFPALGGFLVGFAAGMTTLLVLQISAYLGQRSLMEEFVDWGKVEQEAKEVEERNSPRDQSTLD